VTSAATLEEGSAPVAGIKVAALAHEEPRILACVHCGFCLDACPTYTRLNDEADSPRGRLYLIRAVAEGRLAPDADAFHTHIDRCLGCRACEPVCPSGVQYGHLLERARSALAEARGLRLGDRLLLQVFGSPVINRIAGAFGRVLRARGMARRLARALPARFGRVRSSLLMLDATRPARALRPGNVRGGTPATPIPATPGTPSAATVAHPRVALLEGCVQKTLFERVNLATDRVLRFNGCETVTVPGQGCCGALHGHVGDLAGARRLARANIEAFEAAGVAAVVVNAAGCSAFMKSYGELLEGDPLEDRARALASSVRDVSEFLLARGPRTGAPLVRRVAYDAPCHLIHAQRLGDAPVAMLAAVPGLEVVRIEGAEECCGGAGTWGLAHPELGGRIQQDKVRNVRAAGADLVATPNPGCMMQIGAGLRAARDETPVVHPIEILDESYHGLESKP
jgi:glycolate oxidase iron-sulfur subunit